MLVKIQAQHSVYYLIGKVVEAVKQSMAIWTWHYVIWCLTKKTTFGTLDSALGPRTFYFIQLCLPLFLSTSTFNLSFLIENKRYTRLYSKKTKLNFHIKRFRFSINHSKAIISSVKPHAAFCVHFPFLNWKVEHERKDFFWQKI